VNDFLSSKESLFARLESSEFNQRRVCREEGMGQHRLSNAIKSYEGLEDIIKERYSAINSSSNKKLKETRPPWEYAEWRVKEEAYKREINREKRINKELTSNSSVVRATAAIVVPWMEEHMRLPEIKKPKSPKGDNKAIWILASINDNHFGATFELSIMGQLNAFSPTICALRIERLSDVIRMWVANYERLGNPVAGIVLAFNGDNFNGSLSHEDTNNYARVVKQAGDIAAIHAQFIWEIAQIVPEVLCVCPAADNHTRSTKKSVNSGAAASTSWSTFYYWAMKAMLKSVNHVRFHIDIDRQVFIQICGFTWGITHGDLLKGGGGSLGFPAYGAARHHNASVAETVILAKRAAHDIRIDDAKLSPEDRLMMMMKAVEGIVDHSLLAHFHVDMKLPLPGGKLHVAPSLMGADPFAKDNLRKFSPAEQIFWAIHPEHDIMGEHTVRLQHIIEERDSRYYWGVLEDDLKSPDDFFEGFVNSRHDL